MASRARHSRASLRPMVTFEMKSRRLSAARASSSMAVTAVLLEISLRRHAPARDALTGQPIGKFDDAARERLTPFPDIQPAIKRAPLMRAIRHARLMAACVP